MKTLLFFSCVSFLTLILSECKEIDTKLLRCLVCRATVKEIQWQLAEVDPSREVEIGNYRMDAKGNTVHKRVPLIQSEVFISDMLDSICEKMSDYVRATYKSNGQLTILNLMTSEGVMNPEMSKVDIIQDGDLNKSLKYYCETIVEEYEDNIISLFIEGKTNVKNELCTNVAHLCNSMDDSNEVEQETGTKASNEDHSEL